MSPFHDGKKYPTVVRCGSEEKNQKDKKKTLWVMRKGRHCPRSNLLMNMFFIILGFFSPLLSTVLYFISWLIYAIVFFFFLGFCFQNCPSLAFLGDTSFFFFLERGYFLCIHFNHFFHTSNQRSGVQKKTVYDHKKKKKK